MPEVPIGANSDDIHAANDIQIALPEEKDSPPLPELCAQTHGTVEAFLSAEPKNGRVKAAQEQTRIGLGVCREALEKYSLDELSLSYNGGKDCLVLLILYLTALHAHYGQPSTSNPTNNASDHPTNHERPSQLPSKLNSVHIIGPHPFRAVDDFVHFSARKYHLNISHYNKPMREAFSLYLQDSPSIRAIFVGTRRTDPHGADLTFFDETDRGWPSFMRIHPVIDWHYAEIWTFIRELGLEYCGLYDLGYTSLGGTTDTHPNPALAVKREGKDGDGEGEGYRPAYELVEDEEERLGRDR